MKRCKIFNALMFNDSVSRERERSLPLCTDLQHKSDLIALPFSQKGVLTEVNRMRLNGSEETIPV